MRTVPLHRRINYAGFGIGRVLHMGIQAQQDMRMADTLQTMMLTLLIRLCMVAPPNFYKAYRFTILYSSTLFLFRQDIN
jgi:hypothetical protein